MEQQSSLHIGTKWTLCTVRVFRQKFALSDAIGSHSCSLQVNMRVTNGIPLGIPLPLTVAILIYVDTLKDGDSIGIGHSDIIICPANVRAVRLVDGHPNVVVLYTVRDHCDDALYHHGNLHVSRSKRQIELVNWGHANQFLPSCGIIVLGPSG
jgi:hypothetical protein